MKVMVGLGLYGDETVLPNYCARHSEFGRKVAAISVQCDGYWLSEFMEHENRLP